jgi:hypothetical protein
LEPEEEQALMLPVEINDPNERRDIANALPGDAEREYFEYRFRYDLASLLDCDSDRIIISSLSRRAVPPGPVAYYPVFVNAIFTSGGNTERSPLGLVSLLKALQNDHSSAMYSPGMIFQYVNKTYVVPPIKVRMCGSEYRIFCPFDEANIMSWGSAHAWFWVGTILFACIFIVLCGGIWLIDRDRADPIDDYVLETLMKEPEKVKEPEIRLEFARSWLEGRFMGERWQKSRNTKLLAIGPHT